MIVPAYNEACRILETLEPILEATLVDHVVVVSDGSTDGTAQIASKLPGVTVVDLPFNVGKGGAMCAGVAHTDAEIVCFVDADLVGLCGHHVDQIVAPLQAGECDMCIGVFRGGKFWSDTGQVITPFLSGQRAMRRAMFESVPFLAEIRMGAEITITSYARRLKARVRKVVLQGVSNTHKERKLGFVKGATARAKMYREIAQAMVRIRKRHNKGGGVFK